MKSKLALFVIIILSIMTVNGCYATRKMQKCGMLYVNVHPKEQLKDMKSPGVYSAQFMVDGFTRNEVDTMALTADAKGFWFTIKTKSTDTWYPVDGILTCNGQVIERHLQITPPKPYFIANKHTNATDIYRVEVTFAHNDLLVDEQHTIIPEDTLGKYRAIATLPVRHYGAPIITEVPKPPADCRAQILVDGIQYVAYDAYPLSAETKKVKITIQTESYGSWHPVSAILKINGNVVKKDFNFSLPGSGSYDLINQHNGAIYTVSAEVYFAQSSSSLDRYGALIPQEARCNIPAIATLKIKHYSR